MFPNDTHKNGPITLEGTYYGDVRYTMVAMYYCGHSVQAPAEVANKRHPADMFYDGDVLVASYFMHGWECPRCPEVIRSRWVGWGAHDTWPNEILREVLDHAAEDCKLLGVGGYADLVGKTFEVRVWDYGCGGNRISWPVSGAVSQIIGYDRPEDCDRWELQVELAAPDGSPVATCLLSALLPVSAPAELVAVAGS